MPMFIAHGAHAGLWRVRQAVPVATEEAGYAHHDELDRLGQAGVALAVLDMVFSTPDWVHRRGETAVFVSDKHIRRQVTLDLTVPNPCPASVDWFDDTPVRLLPIDVLAKRRLVNFDTADEDGRPFSVLTRRQNGQVAHRGMVAYANQVLGAAGLKLLPPLGVEMLRRITQESPDVAAREIDRFEGFAPRYERAKVLFDDDGFQQSVWMLASNFLLIAAVHAEPGERRILKHSYEAPHTVRDRRPRIERIRENWGWTPTTIEIDVPAFSDCESYHFEAVAPDGVEFVDIVLGDEQRVGPDGYDPDWALGHNRVIADSPHRAHLAVSRTSDSAAKQDEFLDPTVSVTVQVSREGWFGAATLAALFVALFLSGSAYYIAQLDEPTPPECPTTEQPTDCDPEALPVRLNTDPAALMVALVGVATLAVVRTGEHVYTATRIRPLRRVALASALLPVAAGWLLVFPGPGTTLTAGWFALCAIAWLAAAVLGTTFNRRQK